MKSFIFTEDQLQNLDEIGKALFSEENDPRSFNYVRVLKRPQIKWIRVILYFLIPSLVTTALVLLSIYFEIPTGITAIVISGALVVYIVLTLKRVSICAIKIYQKYAPDSVRNKCRFEPSCSEYMILAIEKYGLVKGMHKGRHRLRRCNICDGGFDYP